MRAEFLDVCRQKTTRRNLFATNHSSGVCIPMNL